MLSTTRVKSELIPEAKSGQFLFNTGLRLLQILRHTGQCETIGVRYLDKIPDCPPPPRFFFSSDPRLFWELEPPMILKIQKPGPKEDSEERLPYILPFQLH